MYFVSIASRVVPAMSVTTTNRSSPLKALMNDDFPAAGLLSLGNGSSCLPLRAVIQVKPLRLIAEFQFASAHSEL